MFSSCIPESSITYTVNGKKINHGSGLGLKILLMCQAWGHEKALQWLEKAIKKILLQDDDLATKFKS